MTTTQSLPLGQLDKILLATDGSEFSAGAEREAINLARLLGSQLFIMSVVHGFPEDDALALRHLIEKEAEKANSYMTAINAKAVEASVICENILRNGDAPYKEIVDTAEEQEVDLIVMGRRGKKNMMRFLVGASTAEVIGTAHCSVLVTPRTANIEGKNILLAVDGSPYSDRATTAAINLAKRLNAQITLISVVYSEHKESRRREAETVVECTKKLLESEGVHVQSQIVTGRYAESIVETAQNIGCDLIMVGSHGRTGLKKLLLGSVSERVIGLAQCAVLVVKG
jgi:uncharacterized protein